MPAPSKNRLQQLQLASKLRYCLPEQGKVVRLPLPPKKKEVVAPKIKPRKGAKNKGEINWDLVRRWASLR